MSALRVIDNNHIWKYDTHFTYINHLKTAIIDSTQVSVLVLWSGMWVDMFVIALASNQHQM